MPGACRCAPDHTKANTMTVIIFDPKTALIAIDLQKRRQQARMTMTGFHGDSIADGSQAVR
jgi:hypothetical protein